MREMRPYLFILRLRFLQAYRLIKTSGPFIVLFALFLVSGVLLSGVDFLGAWNSWVAGLLTGTVLWGVHFSRKDVNFLKHLDLKLPLLFLLEYVLVMLPFQLLFLLYHNFQALLGLYLSLLLIAFLPQWSFRKETTKHLKILSYIPIDCFEVRAGLRARFWGFLLLLILGLGAPLWVGLLPLVIFFSTVLFVSFFEFFEAKELLETEKYHSFLRKKIGRNILLFNSLWLLPYVLFLLFHWQYWYFILLMMLYNLLWLSFAIVYKYANYSPFRERAYASTLVSIFGISALIPYLLPVNILLLIWYYRKAIRTLNFNALYYA